MCESIILSQHLYNYQYKQHCNYIVAWTFLVELAEKQLFKLKVQNFLKGMSGVQ